MTQRCVLVCGSFAPREGGAERQMRQVLSPLSHEGGERVSVVTQVLPGHPRREVLPGTGLTIYRVGSAVAFARVPRVGQLLFLTAAAFRLLVLRPTVVVSLQFGSATTAGSLVARIFRARHIIRLTGGGTSRYRSEAIARAASPVGRRVVALAGSYARAVVVSPARHLLVDLREAFPNLTSTTMHIPNGVVAPDRMLAGPRAGVVWYARAGSERPTSAFLDIAARCPSLEFTVIGQPIECDLPNVTCIGWCEDVYDVLGRARVLLNTSENEGMPNLALQAVAAGCHVVGAANAGLIELRDDFPRYVSLFELGRSDQAADHLMRTHALELLGPGSPVTSEAAAQQWHELLVGAARWNA